MMKLSLGRPTAIAALLAPLAACVSIVHNIPDNPVSQVPRPGGLTLYADANGHLYPNDWDPPYARPQIQKRHSLLASRKFDPDVHASLRAERERQLDAGAARFAHASRVFVLVHGFNNTHGDARRAFDAVRKRLPADSAIVEFHWDGLSSPNIAGQAKMWFNAVGYSQVAGTQALRGLLRRLGRQDIVIIAHSRGASVTLSALSDPAYDRKFRRRTRKLLDRNGVIDFSSDPLPEASGRIDVLLLAPAIGKPDFWRPKGRGEGCAAYRDFPQRLRSLHYAVNPMDPVLRKKIRPLASYFNATDFGLDAEVGRALEHCYKGKFVMTGYPIDAPPMKPLPCHPFTAYARHEIFAKMLAAIGLTPTAGGEDPNPPCGNSPGSEAAKAPAR